MPTINHASRPIINWVSRGPYTHNAHAYARAHVQRRRDERASIKNGKKRRRRIRTSRLELAEGSGRAPCTRARGVAESGGAVGRARVRVIRSSYEA